LAWSSGELGPASDSGAIFPTLSPGSENGGWQAHGEATYTGRFIEGFIMGFLQKIDLQPGVKKCLRENSKTFGENFVRGLRGVVSIIADFVGHQANMNEVLQGLNALNEIMTLVSSASKISHDCLQPDAIAVMEAAMQHLRNATYIKTRLTANGIDVMKSLADAVPMAEMKNYTAVGRDFGTLMRKIVLSRQSGLHPMVLPEGMPKAQAEALVGEQIVDGIIQGMFAPGSNVTITSSMDPAMIIGVDLHRCIAKEAKYFTGAIDAIFVAVTQMSANIEQWQLKSRGIRAAPTTEESSMSWMGKLAGLLSNIPVLMVRCGLSPEQRNMFSEALQNMDAIEMAFGIPGDQNRTAAGIEASIKFAEATEDWKAGKYDKFGWHMGGLLRDLLLVMYPRRYTMTNGMLSRKLDAEQGADGAFFTGRLGALPLACGISGFLWLVGMTILRTFRPCTSGTSLLQLEDLEAHTDEEVE
jgi:hypothetical protein